MVVRKFQERTVKVSVIILLFGVTTDAAMVHLRTDVDTNLVDDENH